MPKYVAQLLIEGKDSLEEIQEWLNQKLMEDLVLDHSGMDVTSVLGIVQLPPFLKKRTDGVQIQSKKHLIPKAQTKWEVGQCVEIADQNSQWKGCTGHVVNISPLGSYRVCMYFGPGDSDTNWKYDWFTGGALVVGDPTEVDEVAPELRK